ncbi:hypothetical protein DFH09DRAFT_1088988 [Mycena vulgaris]|nr:hypothetical protein DFH09DRAFT_1088988 [Mycena vulgaris]
MPSGLPSIALALQRHRLRPASLIFRLPSRHPRRSECRVPMLDNPDSRRAADLISRPLNVATLAPSFLPAIPLISVLDGGLQCMALRLRPRLLQLRPCPPNVAITYVPVIPRKGRRCAPQPPALSYAHGEQLFPAIAIHLPAPSSHLPLPSSGCEAPGTVPPFVFTSAPSRRIIFEKLATFRFLAISRRRPLVGPLEALRKNIARNAPPRSLIHPRFYNRRSSAIPAAIVLPPSSLSARP